MPDPVFRAGFGCETGGNEETPTVAFPPTIQNRAAGPGSPRPDEEYTAKYDWKANKSTWLFAPGTSDWITVGVYIRFENDNPGAAQNFLRVLNETPAEYLRLEFTSTANRVELFDANNVSKGNYSGWDADTWYYVLVKFKKQNSTDLQVTRHTLADNGDIVTSELLWDLSAFDAEPGGTQLQVMMAQNLSVLDGGAGVKDFHTDSVVIVTDSGANIDSVDTFNFDYTFLVYQNTTQGTASDFGGDNSDTSWSRAGELPANDALYALFTMGSGVTKQGGVYTNDGARTGPNGDSRLPAAGALFGAEYVWRVVDHSGTPKFWGRYGNNGGIPSTTTPADITAAVNKVEYINASDSAMPTSSEVFAIGMDAQAVRGAGGLRMLEMWANLIVRRAKVPVVTAAPGIIHRGMIDAA